MVKKIMFKSRIVYPDKDFKIIFIVLNDIRKSILSILHLLR